MSPDTDINFVGTPADPLPKPKGRPKGSKNKPKESADSAHVDTFVAPDPGVEEHNGKGRITDYDHTYTTVLLQSHEVPEGLEMVLQRHVIVGLSALPNGNASIITNIGTDQPLILVTAEPYVDIKKRLYPDLEQSA